MAPAVARDLDPADNLTAVSGVVAIFVAITCARIICRTVDDRFLFSDGYRDPAPRKPGKRASTWRRAGCVCRVPDRTKDIESPCGVVDRPRNREPSETGQLIDARARRVII